MNKDDINKDNINDIDEICGMTLLHMAIEKRDINLIHDLLNLGADPNISDELDHLPLNYGGSYPLHYAVEYGYPEIVEILLQHGANPSIRNRDNELPIDIAYSKRPYKSNKENYNQIINLLQV